MAKKDIKSADAETASAKSNSDKIEFKLSQILSLDFSYRQLTIPFEQASGGVNYNVTPNIAVSLERNEIIVTMSVVGTLTQTKEDFFNASTRFIFLLQNLSSILGKKEDNTVQFKDKVQEKNLITSLIGISYSTLRGMIIEKGSGTILQMEFLPLVDPQIFLKNNLK
jgi:hypothetical protein